MALVGAFAKANRRVVCCLPEIRVRHPTAARSPNAKNEQRDGRGIIMAVGGRCLLLGRRGSLFKLLLHASPDKIASKLIGFGADRRVAHALHGVGDQLRTYGKMMLAQCTASSGCSSGPECCGSGRCRPLSRFDQNIVLSAMVAVTVTLTKHWETVFNGRLILLQTDLDRGRLHARGSFAARSGFRPTDPR